MRQREPKSSDCLHVRDCECHFAGVSCLEHSEPPLMPIQNQRGGAMSLTLSGFKREMTPCAEANTDLERILDGAHVHRSPGDVQKPLLQVTTVTIESLHAGWMEMMY